MGSHTGESYLVDYTQRTSGTCLVPSTTIEFRGPSGANDWKPFDLQDLTLSRCYEYLPFELIIGVIGWCSRGAFLLTCKRNGVNVKFGCFSILITRPGSDICGVGHPWAQCHLVEQRRRLSSSKPNRWFLEVCGSSFQVGLDVILRPGPFNDAERDFGGLPYWLLKWVRLFGLHLLIQGGWRKTEDQWPKVFRSSEVLVHHIVFKVDVSSLSKYP